MNYAKWSDSLLTGFPLIDSQHQEIFEQAEKFLESGRTGHSKEQLGEMLTFFESYINRHLAIEEELQKQYDYPDYSSHKRLHDNYRKQYWNLRKQFDHDGAQYHLAVKAIQFTIDWLANHINYVDKSMAGFIKTRNRQEAQQVNTPR
jgi:hemerythrin